MMRGRIGWQMQRGTLGRGRDENLWCEESRNPCVLQRMMLRERTVRLQMMFPRDALEGQTRRMRLNARDGRGGAAARRGLAPAMCAQQQQKRQGPSPSCKSTPCNECAHAMLSHYKGVRTPQPMRQRLWSYAREGEGGGRGHLKGSSTMASR